jgi:autotransporter-associated beta strand protein
MKPTKTSRFSKPSHILVGSIAACAVLGLASSASAQTHNWLAPAPGLLWSSATNWSPASVPGTGNTVRFELSVAHAALGTIIMDKNYDGLAGNPTLGFVRFTGNEIVSIQNYLKITDTTTALQLANGSGGPANVSVPAGGTIDSFVRLANETGRPAPVLNFTGGNWVAGNITTENSGRQGGIIRVSSTSGTLTPGAAVISQTPQPLATNRPAFNFVLTGAGATAVAPIAFSNSNPFQFTGGAAGTNPFTLTVDTALYSGATVDIPLITHASDTDRLFSSGNITIGTLAAGKGAFVTQTDTATTVTLTDAGTWSGTNPTSWGTDGVGGNWSGGTAPGGAAIPIAHLPAGVANVTANLDGATPTLAVLNINSGAAAASAYTIATGSGGNINLGATPTGSAFAAAQINVLKGTANTISAPVTLLMNGQVSTAASTSLAMSGAISGGFALAKEGAGTLSLSSATNSYTGATNINGGILEIVTTGQLGSGTYAGDIAMASGATFRYNGNANQTLSGVISGAGSLTKLNSASTLTLSNANTFTSNTAVTGGKIALGHAQALQFSAYDVTGSNGTTTGVDVNGFFGDDRIQRRHRYYPAAANRRQRHLFRQHYRRDRRYQPHQVRCRHSNPLRQQ